MTAGGAYDAGGPPPRTPEGDFRVAGPSLATPSVSYRRDSNDAPSDLRLMPAATTPEPDRFDTSRAAKLERDWELRELELREREVAMRATEVALRERSLEIVEPRWRPGPPSRTSSRPTLPSPSVLPRRTPISPRGSTARSTPSARSIAASSARLARGLPARAEDARSPGSVRGRGGRVGTSRPEQSTRLDSSSKSQLVPTPEEVQASSSSLRDGLQAELQALRSSVLDLERAPSVHPLAESANALLGPGAAAQWTLLEAPAITQERLDQLVMDNARLRLLLAKCIH